MRLLNTELATHRAVSLSDILACREQRQARQQQWLAQYATPLISLTLVAPGPIKDSVLTRSVFNLAIRALQNLFDAEGWAPLAAETFELTTGAEALIALNVNAERLKQAVIQLEEQRSVGRLWDIDVIDAAGNILSRADSGLSGRACLICGADARACGRSRTHSFAELTQAMERLVADELRSVPPLYS